MVMSYFCRGDSSGHSRTTAQTTKRRRWKQCRKRWVLQQARPRWQKHASTRNGSTEWETRADSTGCKAKLPIHVPFL